MKARTRHALVLAVTTALVAPVANAQESRVMGKAVGQTVAQVPQPASPRSPPPASTAAAEALLNTNAPPSLQTLNETEPPPAPEVEQAAMNPPKPPPRSQGAGDAASHSAVAQRGIWAQLDVNGDGRISGSEGQVDADFQSNFEMMDADRDGFVTAVEYRAQAKSEPPEPEPEEEERDD